MLPPKSKYKIFQTELLHEPIIQRFQLTIKEASTVLCSVIKHAGSGRARKKCRGKHKTQWRVFHLFLSALQQNRAQSRLLYLFYDKEFIDILVGLYFFIKDFAIKTAFPRKKVVFFFLGN